MVIPGHMPKQARRGPGRFMAGLLERFCSGVGRMCLFVYIRADSCRFVHACKHTVPSKLSIHNEYRFFTALLATRFPKSCSISPAAYLHKADHLSLSNLHNETTEAFFLQYVAQVVLPSTRKLFHGFIPRLAIILLRRVSC